MEPLLGKISERLKKSKTTLLLWLFGLTAIIFSRFFLEAFSSPTSNPFFFSDFSTYAHYYLYFLSFALALVLLIRILFPPFKEKALELTAIFYGFILLAPILDIALSQGEGSRLLYLFNDPKQMVWSYLSFLGQLVPYSGTIGIRLEVVSIVFLFGFFAYLVKKNFLKAVISGVALYSLIFFFGSLPSIIPLLFGHFEEPLIFWSKSLANSSTIINNLPPYLNYANNNAFLETGFNFLMAKLFFVILVIFSGINFYLFSKEKFLAFVHNSRPERLARYILDMVFGGFLASLLFPSLSFNWVDWLSVLVLLLSFFFSAIFAICTNDLEDESIDRVSNQDRPLVSKKIDRKEMKTMAVFSFLLAVVSGYLSGFAPFFFIVAFTALYYIYSNYPTRYKTIPFFSSFIIGLCCLSIVLVGFFFVSSVKDLAVFPKKIALIVIIFYFFWSHFRDIKDIEGDKKAGIKTVAVLFGEKWGRRTVGFLTGFSFISIPLLSGIGFFYWSAIPAALASYFFVNRKSYSEKLVFIVYIAFVFFNFLLFWL